MKKGFSLIEILVAISVFMTAMLVANDIFLTVSIAQRETARNQRAANDLDYNLKYMANIFKENKIIYDSNIDNPVQRLSVLNQNGDTVSLYLSNRTIYESTVLADGTIETPVSLAVPGLSIKRLDFYLYPTNDPYKLNPLTGEYASDDQSQVTIVIEGDTLDNEKINLQTTISSRLYAR